MKKENFKEENFMHDPKKMKNEKKSGQSQRSDDAEDEDDSFDETLRKGSRNKANPSMRDQSRED